MTPRRLPPGDDAALIAASNLARIALLNQRPRTPSGAIELFGDWDWPWIRPVEEEIERRAAQASRLTSGTRVVPESDLIFAQGEALAAQSKLDQIAAVVKKWWQDRDELRSRVHNILTIGKEIP